MTDDRDDAVPEHPRDETSSAPPDEGVFDDAAWISAYADDQLGSAERAEAERRLAGDADLQLELEAVVAARDVLRRVPPVEPPPGFLDGLVARVAAIPDGPDSTDPRGDVVDIDARRWRRPGARVAAVVAAAAVVALAIALPSRDDATPELPVLAEAHFAEIAGDDPIAQLPALAIPGRFDP